MTGLKVVTYWVRPAGDSLPEARALLEGLLAEFYQSFPEYQGSLVFSQAPRAPRHLFIYVGSGCTGLLPGAGAHLRHLLERAFPTSEVRGYGKRWLGLSD